MNGQIIYLNGDSCSIHSISMPLILSDRRYPDILNKNINATCKVLVPCFMNWNKISQKCTLCIKSLFFSNVYIPVSELFSFAKIIHPPDRCDISRSWLNCVIFTQVLGTTKGHSKMCSFVTQHNATDASSWGACHRHADCRNVHQSCCQRI